MKKTFKQIREFNIASEGFMKRNPTNMQTKLGYALKRVSEKSISKAAKEYSNAYSESYYTNVEKIQIDNALTDKVTGAILAAPKDSERPYLYDKEGLKAVMEAENRFSKETAQALLEEFDSKEFEIDPFLAKELPEDLTDEEIEAFKGFVI
jgi:hypothetical protein